MTQEQTVFIAADQALNQVIQSIQDDKWESPADTIPHMGLSEDKLTLKDIVNRHAYDDAWVPETLAGKTIAEVGTAYDGDLLGTDPKAKFASYVTAAVDAVQALTPADLDRIAHLTYGDFPIREYLKHITSFRGFRTYTIAKFIGGDTTLPPELVDGLWDEVVPHVEEWRAMGVFGPAIAVPEAADKQTKLLGLTGFLQ